MNKILLFVFFSLLHIGLLFSQSTKDNGSLSLSVGPAVAIGKFAAKDLNRSSSGFAKTGESVSLSYSKLLSKHWGFSLDIHGQRNPLNTNALESSFSQAKIYDGLIFSPGTNPPPQSNYAIYPNWKFEKKPWLSGALLAGVNGQFALDKPGKVNLVTKVMLGAVYVTSPGLSGSSMTDIATANISQNKSSGFGFIYSVSGGLNYYVSNAIFLCSSLAYIGTNQITFKDVKQILTTAKGSAGSPEYSVQQSTTTGSSKQMISSVNLSFGIGIKL